MKLSDDIVVNAAVAGAAVLTLVVQAAAHLWTPAASAAGLTALDGNCHDLVIGCIGFLARSVVRTPAGPQ